MTSPAISNTPAKSTGQDHPKPGVLTRAALLAAAVLPWYAVLSGTYGLYFYILMIVPHVGGLLSGAAGEVAETTLFIATLSATVPLETLVSLAMPAGAI